MPPFRFFLRVFVLRLPADDLALVVFRLVLVFRLRLVAAERRGVELVERERPRLAAAGRAVICGTAGASARQHVTMGSLLTPAGLARDHSNHQMHEE